MTPDSRLPTPLPSSFRDDAGFVFRQEGVIYRQVNTSFLPHFSAFRERLLPAAVEQGLVIPLEEVKAPGASVAGPVLKPQQLPFISYPFEWSFSMLKEAALATLRLALMADGAGLELRDATPYNLQWVNGRMQHIDHLSFGLKEGDVPWLAYRQFCESFLAPLALMHYHQVPLQSLGLGWMEGVPLEVVTKWLPFRSRFSLHHLLHLHLHANAVAKGVKERKTAKTIGPEGRKRIYESLQSAVKGLHYSAPSGVWSQYYGEAGQRSGYLERKGAVIQAWLGVLKPRRVFDCGANEGHFSLLTAKDPGCTVISAEPDHYSVDRLFKRLQGEGISNVHPILFDFAHPSPSIGLNGQERPGIFQRAEADLVLALALVHHLFFTDRIPFSSMAQGFRLLGRNLLIEWVPPEDDKTKEVVAGKKEVKEGYSLEAFQSAFAAHFTIDKVEEIQGSGRRLLLLRGR